MGRRKFFKLFDIVFKTTFQLFGYFPISSFESEISRKLTEYTLRVWATTIVSGIVYYTLHAVCNHEELFSTYIIGKANDVLKLTSVYVAFALNVIETNFRWKKLLKMEVLLRDFQKIRNYQKVQPEMRRNYLWKFFAMFLVVFVIETQITLTFTSNKWKCYWLLVVIPIVACRLRTMQYIHYQNLIRFYAKMINQELEAIVAVSRDIEYHSLTERLRELRKFYRLLHKITELMNKFFCFSIVITLVHEFIESGSEYYYIYMSVFETIDDNLLTVYISAFGPTVFMLLPLYEAEKIAEEIDKTVRLLHSIRKSEDDVKLQELVCEFFLLKLKF